MPSRTEAIPRSFQSRRLTAGAPSNVALAGELLQAFAARGQFGLLDDQHRKAVLDLETELTLLADKSIAREPEARLARVHRTAKDVEQLGTDHRTVPRRVCRIIGRVG